MIQKTKHYSYKIGPLAKGCQLCIKGSKSVLFVTGLCSNSCFYCPISEQKYKKDVVYINEWPTDKLNDAITEIKLCSSKGVGITGGDPLVKIDRTIKYIKSLKKKFGSGFHIHLYTPLTLVTDSNLKKLYSAELDEIRFHPDLEKINPQSWEKIKTASNKKQFSWTVGVEIPVIPGLIKETKKLIKYLAETAKIDFLNLNELEISDTNANQLVERGFMTKDRISYGVRGSHPMALILLKYCDQLKIRTHYCTCKLKDGVQLRNRIKKRAKGSKKAFDYITGEGMLIRGAIYLKKSNITSSLPNAKKELNKTTKMLISEFEIPPDLIQIDVTRQRILTSVGVVLALTEELKELKLMPAIVEEYPTFDCFNVRTEFL